MSNEKLESILKHIPLVAGLRSGIGIHPRSGEFESVNLSNGWEQIGNIVDDDVDPYKIKAVHRGEKLFAKGYSPETQDYSLRVYIASLQLSRMQLTYPILAPIGHVEKTLLYPLGEDKGDIHLRRLPPQEVRVIKAVVEAQGLTALGFFDRAALVDIDGVTHLTDPIEDSVNSIFEYLEARKKSRYI